MIRPAWIYAVLQQMTIHECNDSIHSEAVCFIGRESYHHMCRYYSGFFHQHPLLQDFDYYWRMEPDVHYYCDLDYDPFLFMQVGATLLI